MASLTLKHRWTKKSHKKKIIKTQNTRAFQESWKLDNNWLRFDNESKSMYCDALSLYKPIATFKLCLTEFKVGYFKKMCV